MYLSTSTLNLAKSKYKSKYSSKNIGKYKYFVKKFMQSILKILVKYGQVHRTLHLCFIMVKVKAMKTQKQQYYAYACMSAVPGIYHHHI